MSNSVFISAQGFSNNGTQIVFPPNLTGVFEIDKIATTSTDGLMTQNLTPSTAGIPVQMSPAFKWIGTAFNSTSGLSETREFHVEVLPATVAGTTTALWKLQTSLNGGAVSNVLSVSQAGTLTAGTLVSSSSVSLANSGLFAWLGRAVLASPADGQINLSNNLVNAGIGFDVNMDAVLMVRTRAQSAYAQVDALGYSVGGVAGASRGAGAVTSLTVVNGIITAIT